MYEVIKNAINNTEFDLRAIIGKIDIFFTEDKLSEEERNELISLARSKAKAENSYDVQKQLDNIFARLEALENKNNEVEDTEPTDEYPEYIQPTGAHDAYQVGDKITFKEKRYICKMNGCAYSPEEYPMGWEEVTEDNVEV